MERTKNSHIQIPKFILKHFADQNQSLFQLDVDTRIIKPGRPTSMNTQVGYFSNETEDYLSAKFETPFSRLIQRLLDHDFDNANYIAPLNLDHDVKEFISLIIARNPRTYLKTKKHQSNCQQSPKMIG